jgi:hypothetical protein
MVRRRGFPYGPLRAHRQRNREATPCVNEGHFKGMITFQVQEFVPRSYGDGDYFGDGKGTGNGRGVWNGWNRVDYNGSGDGWDIFRLGHRCPSSYEPLIDELSLVVFLQNNQ